MGTSMRIQLSSVDEILLKRSLNQNGKAQRFFTHEVRRLSDPYVPMLNGVLKNTGMEKPGSIEYVQPYARRQYYEARANGLRGKEWDKRMWADRGKEIVRSVAEFAGGRAE